MSQQSKILKRISEVPVLIFLITVYLVEYDKV